MTKNKIKALLLAICLVIPTMFTLVACGHKHTYGNDWSKDATYHWHVCTGKDCNETEKAKHTYVTKHNDTQYWQECSVCGYAQEKVTGTVNEDEWKSALNFENVTNFNYRLIGDISIIDIKANATSAIKTNHRVSTNKLVTKEIYAVEGTDDNQAIYTYKYNPKNESDLSKDLWTKTKSSKPVAELFSLVNPKSGFSSMLGTKNSFEYNAETGIYESTDTVTYSGVTANMKLKFANTKLVWYEYIIATGSNEGSTGYCDISYDETEVELPTMTSVTAEEWQNALSFNDLNNFTMEKTSTNSTVTSTEKISVTSTSLKREVTSGGTTTTNVFDTEHEQRYTKTGSEEKYTRYDFGINMDTLLRFSNLSGAPTSYYNSILNSFDSAEYKADEQIYYILEARIFNQNAINIKLTFSNRRLVKIEYITTVSGSNYTNTITYTYNDTTIALPTASETVTYVYHNSSYNAFRYSGVSLSAGENVFEIEISDDKYASNKIGGVYMLGGTFSVSSGSATISSITAKNASGTTITNEATGANNMTFTNLSAGKYYITITVSADCTGTFNLYFKQNNDKAYAVSVPYSTGFSLENVNLSSGDNWFVVEISDTDHSSNKIDGTNYQLTGKFTITSEGSSNLTITAKDSKDADVANTKTGVGAVNGAMTFKTLSAGKYYICVNASAECTGNFSLSFALKDV